MNFHSKKELTAAIRTALKGNGYNCRKVSVSCRNDINAYVYVTIRENGVSKDAVEKIVRPFENLRLDETGWILGGGNTFVDVIEVFA